ncbi:MAG TPA: hypothetical protein VKG45_11590 [Actinomycetes bacterium]|nr:hypothetical protein [Actinomycetes bacterium]
MAVAADPAGGRPGPASGASRAQPSTAWCDWGAFAVGAALAATPLLRRGHGDGVGAAEAILIGLAIMTTAVAARVARLDRWHFQGLLVAFGLWSLLMPVVWTYVADVYRLASGVAGALVVLLMVPPLWLAWRAASRRRAEELDAAAAGPTVTLRGLRPAGGPPERDAP